MERKVVKVTKEKEKESGFFLFFSLFWKLKGRTLLWCGYASKFQVCFMGHWIKYNFPNRGEPKLRMAMWVGVGCFFSWKSCQRPHVPLVLEDTQCTSILLQITALQFHFRYFFPSTFSKLIIHFWMNLN